jgi:hypothetical protein
VTLKCPSETAANVSEGAPRLLDSRVVCVRRLEYNVVRRVVEERTHGASKIRVIEYVLGAATARQPVLDTIQDFGSAPGCVQILCDGRNRTPWPYLEISLPE